MDPFTQRMLERAKVRREKLENHISTNKVENKTLFEESSKINKENDSSSKGVDIVSDNVSSCMNNRSDPSAARKLKLQKLALQYSSSENAALMENKQESIKDCPKILSEPPKSRFGRLAQLASKINEWDNEENSQNHFSSSQDKVSNLEEVKENKKPSIWNPMVKKLCSQGYSLSENKLSYQFEEKKNERNVIQEERETHKSYSNLDSHTSNSPYSKPKVKLNNITTVSKNEFKNQCKDPAELTLAERKALFENNISVANTNARMCYMHTLPEDSRKLENSKFLKAVTPKRIVPTAQEVDQHQVTDCFTSLSEKKVCKSLIDNKNSAVLPTKHEKEVSELLPENPTNLKHSESNSESLEIISNVENSEDCKSKCLEKKISISLDNNTVFQGTGLYPDLNDFNASGLCETETCLLTKLEKSEDDEVHPDDSSMELEKTENDPSTSLSDFSFSKSKEYQVLNKMDKFLENALNDISESEGECPKFSPTPPKVKRDSKFEEKIDDSNSQSLLHTVSFYRKQQQKTLQSTPSDEEEMTPEFNGNQSALVEEKIKMLLTEVSKQQTILSQASQALNLCLSTVEFSGSGEQVESERLLLLASHKRQACLNEIQRLKIENTLQQQGENTLEKGDVTLTNISLKIKRDALRAMASAESLQYFVCLVKSDEQVLATPVVSATRENLKDFNLQFPGSIKLEALSSNFKVSVEIYSLQLNKELLPHDVKYHLVGKKEKRLLTPIKSKKHESKLLKPRIQSPAGPNAVRTSNFQMCGFIVFSLREVSRTQWIMNKVPYVSLLEGSLFMTINSKLQFNDEFRGFLTIFDDISGFGAWHRRWCLLSSHFISFWKYPDDELKKVPLETIDLRSVTTEKVGLVSHDICARLHTFLLETTRPSLSDDKNSLILRVQDNTTTIRHLLSADSKQEMITWCKKLNTVLALLRSWKCSADK